MNHANERLPEPLISNKLFLNHYSIVCTKQRLIKPNVEGKPLWMLSQGYQILDAHYLNYHSHQLYPFIGTDLGVCTKIIPEVAPPLSSVFALFLSSLLIVPWCLLLHLLVLWLLFPRLTFTPTSESLATQVQRGLPSISEVRRPSSIPAPASSPSLTPPWSRHHQWQE